MGQVFEQPMSEAIRICLRFEQLAEKFSYIMQGEGLETSKAAISTLLETQKLADRPDLKSKLTQTLGQFSVALSQMDHLPHVNSAQLQQVRETIDRFSQQLHATHGRLGEGLRDNDFLDTIRMHSNTPGGICEYASPIYSTWCALPETVCRHQLQDWYSVFGLLNKTVELILQLVRQSAEYVMVDTQDAYHQQTLSLTPPCRMVRVELLNGEDVYPEISVGRHRLSIRFMVPTYETGKKPVQYQKPLQFKLACCQL